MSRQPKRDLRRKQQRKKKLHYLRARLDRTQDPAERRRLIDKIKRISPASPVPER